MHEPGETGIFSIAKAPYYKDICDIIFIQTGKQKREQVNCFGELYLVFLYPDNILIHSSKNHI